MASNDAEIEEGSGGKEPPVSQNSESSKATEEEKELRRLLKLYFFSAIKWKDDACSFHLIYCLIFVVQMVKVSLITAQMLEFGHDRSYFSSNVNRGFLTLKHILLKDWDASLETLPYPPSNGEFAVYTRDDLEASINFAVSSYYNVEHKAAGYFVRNGDDMTVNIKYYDFPGGDIDECSESNFPTKVGLSKTFVGNKTLYNYNITAELDYRNISQCIGRIMSTSLQFELYSARSNENRKLATCLHIKGKVLFTDRYTSGQVEADIHTLTTKIKCASMNVSVEDWQLETILGRLRIATFIFCGASTLLTICSIYFGAFVYWKTKKFMKRHFKTYYGISSNREKDLPQSEYLRFLKFWDILVVASDVLVFLGTEGLKREAERNFILETIDSDTVWLGIGCIFAWFSLLRFLKIHTKFHLLFSTIRYAFWDVFAYLVCVVLLFVGFWVCGYVVMGPYHVKFSTPSDAAETLYALIHGDEVYATFAILEEQKAGGNGVYWFSRFYIGTFVGIFTIVVINLLIALFMNAYETIQEYKKGNTEDSKINALEKALRQYLTSYNDIDNQSSCENNLLSNFYQFLADTNVTSDKAGDLRSELLKLVQVRNGRIEPARRRTLKAFIEEGSQEECFCIIVIPKQNIKLEENQDEYVNKNLMDVWCRQDCT